MDFLSVEQPNLDRNAWQNQLDQFVESNKTLLAALSWGLYQERIDSDMIVGIDLKSTPRLVTCSQTALEKLNQGVNNKLQEILGLIENFDPTQEVLMICIADTSVKLVYFEPDPAPSACFEQMGQTIDALLEQLENQIIQQIKVI
ncbi:MAG: hypothetical protein ACFBSC_06800 [Microcoleaceae cyanobacterium]